MNGGTKPTIMDKAMDEIHNDSHKIYNTQLKVSKLTTDDIWSNEPKDPKKPVHLVIVTHGIFSNLTADMLYIKDQLELKVRKIFWLGAIDITLDVLKEGQNWGLTLLITLQI